MSDIKTMETIMFGAQTANKFLDNGQKYQDNMKDNPKSEANIKRETQKSIKFQVEQRKDSQDHRRRNVAHDVH